MTASAFLENADLKPEVTAKWPRHERRRLEVLRRREATKARQKARMSK